MKFAIIAFGCRANRSDTEWLTGKLLNRGHVRTNSLVDADLVVVHTCTVTAEAARQARQSIRRARKKNPHSIIIAAGCAVVAEPARFLSMHELDFAADLTARGRLDEFLDNLQPGSAPQPIEVPEDGYNPFPVDADDELHPQDRSRAVLKIQDGCENRCTYCVVSRIRGRPTSMPTPEIAEHLKKLKKLGHNEVVLTGIHLGSWGRDLVPERTLEGMLKVLINMKDLPRLRLSSIDPNEISSELMDLLGSSNLICPHLHVPLQSGDDRILESMGRKYRAQQASVRLRLLRNAVPDMAMGLDIIVGFPGETDERFQNTMKTLENMPFDYLHVFPYSPRPGTEAASFPGQVSRKVMRERGYLLREMSARRRDNFWRGQLGTVRNAIIESPRQAGRGFRCRTDNYIPVLIGQGNYRIGEILPLRLVSVKERRVMGEVCI